MAGEARAPEMEVAKGTPPSKPSDVERARGNLRHLYTQMLAGEVKDTAQAARGLLGPAIEVLERATPGTDAAPEPRPGAAEALVKSLEDLARQAERQSKLNPPEIGDPIAIAGPWAWKRMAELLRARVAEYRAAPAAAPPRPPTGAERYLTERMKDPKFAAEYQAEREKLASAAPPRPTPDLLRQLAEWCQESAHAEDRRALQADEAEEGSGEAGAREHRAASKAYRACEEMVRATMKDLAAAAPPRTEPPDAYCLTLPTGECVAPWPCMHGEGDRRFLSRYFSAPENWQPLVRALTRAAPEPKP